MSPFLSRIGIVSFERKNDSLSLVASTIGLPKGHFKSYTGDGRGQMECFAIYTIYDSIVGIVKEY